MSPTIENIIIYGATAIVCLFVIFLYFRKKKRDSDIVAGKLRKAQAEGLHEPVSLHPYVDPRTCIQTGACIAACPEKDILGIINGKATVINASRCIGHGACFHACPTEAISLRIGTEKRGVDLPHVSQTFESNVPGLFIAGELGGMGLIRNAVEQGRQAVNNISGSLKGDHGCEYDLVIVGAGPAGISGALTAMKNGLRFLILEQDTLGGTVFTFPRSKIVMTSPVDLPLYGKVRLNETSKEELLKLWKTVLDKNGISITERTRVESVTRDDNGLTVISATGEKWTAASVLLAIGRRGTPRKLNVPGEESMKVAYRLLEPEEIKGKDIIVAGGGDSAVEAALLLCGNNNVTLTYRGETFTRIKPRNSEAVARAVEEKRLKVLFKSNIVSIEEKKVMLALDEVQERMELANDMVYIFAGGELPTAFLERAGIRITRKFGETVLSH